MAAINQIQSTEGRIHTQLKCGTIFDDCMQYQCLLYKYQ